MLPSRNTLRLLLVCLAVTAACATPLEPPSAAASAKAAEVPVGAVVELDASASADRNTPPLPIYYRWSFRALPAGSAAVLNDPTLVNPSFVADAEGTYVATLVVTSGQLSSAPVEVTVKAGPCGASRPSVGTILAAPATPRLGQAVRLEAPVTDADNESACAAGQTFRWSWWIVSLPAGSAATLNLPTAATPSFTADVEGVYDVAVIVTDSTGRAGAEGRVTVTVSGCGGAAPTVALPVASPAAPGLGETVQLSAAAKDVDNEEACGSGQTLTFRWYFVSLPLASRAALNDAAVDAPSFAPDLPGTYVVRARVEDGTGRFAVSAPLSLTVSSCGSAAPEVDDVEASPAAPITGDVVQLTAALIDADAADPCAIPQSFRYAWRLVGQPAGSLATLNNPGAANPSFTADLPGEYVAELVATDATGRAGALRTFTVTVSECGNAPPVATLEAPEAASIGATVSAGAAIVDADAAEGCGLEELFTYAWSFEALPAGSAARLNAAGLERPSFVPDLEGSYVLRLVVTDSAGHASLPAFAEVEVSACGGAGPVATPEASTTAPGLEKPVLLTARATDADNDDGCEAGQTFTWRWAFDAIPAGSKAALNAPEAVTPSFVPDVPGAYVVRLVATDSTGRASAPGRLTVTATGCGGNVPMPSFEATNEAPAIGELVQLTGAVEDPDNAAACAAGQTFTWRWSFALLPAGSAAAFNDPSAETPSFVPDVEGDYVVRLVVTDSTGRSASEELTLEADPCGGQVPQVVVAPSPASAGVGMVVRLVPAVTDLDNAAGCQARTLPNPVQSFSYAWTLLSAPAGSQAALSSASARTPWIRTDLSGAYVARVVVTDSFGAASAAVDTTVDVGVCGRNPPKFVSAEVDDDAPLAGTPVLLTATIDDADNATACQTILAATQGHSVLWSVVSAPAGSRAGLARADTLGAGFVPDVPGTYLLEVTATDDTGRTAAQTVELKASSCGTVQPAVSPEIDTAASVLRVGGLVVATSNASDTDNSACGLSQTHALRWWIAEQPAGSRAVLSNAEAVNVSFVPDVGGSVVGGIVVGGTYVLALDATDSTGLRSAVKTVTVTVNACGGNRPVAVITGPTTGLVGEFVQVSGASSTDVDTEIGPLACGLSQALSYRWELLSAPIEATAFLGPTMTVSNPSLRPDKVDDYVLRLWVTDSTGLESAPVTHTITIKASP